MGTHVEDRQRARRLRSWKEIAAHLGVDERTVRRWEQRGLPVNRLPGAGRSTVYAERDEVDDWLKGQRDFGPHEEPTLPPAVPQRGPQWFPRRKIWFLIGALCLIALFAGGLWWTHPQAAPTSTAERTEGAPSPRAVALVQAAATQLARATPDGTRRAIDLLGQAIAADPRYAPAYSSLAEAYLAAPVTTASMRASDSYPRALSAAQRALELDPNLAQAHATLGILEFNWNWNFSAGVYHLREVVRLQPNRGPGHFQLGMALLQLGDTHAALGELRLAQQLEVDTPAYRDGYALGRYLDGDRAGAIATWREIVADDPNQMVSHWHLLVAAFAQGDLPAAFREGATVARLREDGRTLRFYADAERAYAAGGARAALDLMLAFARQEVAAHRQSMFLIALVQALRGDDAACLLALRQSVAAREPDALEMRTNPILQRFQNNPQFQALLARIGLTPDALRSG